MVCLSWYVNFTIFYSIFVIFNYFFRENRWYAAAEEKFYTEASGPLNELVYIVLKDLKSFPYIYVLNGLACKSRRLFRLLFHPPRKERLQSPAGKKFPWRQYFSINHNSALIFVGLTRVGFSWGSRLQWPTVNEQVSELEGVINYVVPMGFLEVKNEFKYP